MANLKNTIIDDTGSIELPKGTTAERPSSPSEGMVRFNTDSQTVEYYNGDTWQSSTDVYPEATGGVVVDTEIQGIPYRLHYFTDVGISSFSVSKPGEVDVLLVGGGGGGGSTIGGGGGAGGLVYKESLFVSPQTYSITVGDGGLGGYEYRISTNGNQETGLNGDDTTAFGLTALGGGGGSGWDSNPPGGNGGSGGGGSADAPQGPGSGQQPGTNPTADIDAGNDGGDGDETGGGERAGGGGGGAGAPGEDGDRDFKVGNGGIGLAIDITGVSRFYAGGGGGGDDNDGPNPNPGGFGGLGGGGRGGIDGGASTDPRVQGQNGAPNTGGGGGSGSYTGSSDNDDRIGGKGGSGVVIVRYRKNVELSTAPQLTIYSTTPNNFYLDERNLVVNLDAADPVSYTGTGNTWKDLTGNNYDADLSNISFNSFHRALQFNGSSSLARISNIDIPQTEHTILVWLRSDIPLANTTNSGSRKTIFKADNQWRPGLWMTGQIIRPHMPPEFRDKEFPYNPRRSWFQVGQIFNGTNVFTVENGKKTLDDLQNDSYSEDERTTFDIGTESGRGSATWEGQIAIVQIFDKEFSETELQQNFNFYRRRFGV